ncbi:MAG: sugar ABC transporter permease [Firmicutes bacterium]|nr:sugar ABC transporter permease [Bacillota bacterium]
MEIIQKRKRIKFKKKDLVGWLLMLVPLILFGFFVWYPMIHNVILSFSETRGFSIVGFAGFDNFRYIFTSPDFGAAVGNTFLYVLYSLAIGFIIPLFIALLLSEVINFKGFFRVFFYLPAVISGLTVALLWNQMLSASEQTGVFNVILGMFRIPHFNWLQHESPHVVIPLIIMTMTWRGFGATMLIYLANLQTVDTEQYEAARIDGAGIFGRLRAVTLPHIIPLIRVLFVLQLISVFQVFTEPLVMTHPDSTVAVSLLLLAFRYTERQEANIASAISVFTSLLIITITIFYLWMTRSAEDKKKKKQEKAVKKQNKLRLRPIQ